MFFCFIQVLEDIRQFIEVNLLIYYNYFDIDVVVDEFEVRFVLFIIDFLIRLQRCIFCFIDKCIFFFCLFEFVFIFGFLISL